jgi:hypothetical protein
MRAENCIYKWNRPEFDSMDEIFEKTIGNEFSDLIGLTVDASIPVRQHIINELIEFWRGGSGCACDHGMGIALL